MELYREWLIPAAGGNSDRLASASGNVVRREPTPLAKKAFHGAFGRGSIYGRDRFCLTDHYEPRSRRGQELAIAGQAVDCFPSFCRIMLVCGYC
jgi:hypothetical protein